MHGRPASRTLPALTLAALTACGGLPGEPASNPTLPPLDPVAEAVRQQYAIQFGISVPQPAIFTERSPTPCPTQDFLTTVAYLPTGYPNVRQIFVMHLTRDGLVPVTDGEGLSVSSFLVHVIPAGTIRVLTVILTYPQTLTDADLPAFRRQQDSVNHQHAAFAHSRGFSEPIVQFEFTNVTLAGAGVANPRTLPGIRAALALAGTSTSGYDVVAAINIDPDTSEGGFSVAGQPAFVYMGNYSHWSSRPSEAGFYGIARATYHHEVGHHWGWAHQWTPWCGGTPPFDPFITAPVLFGWEDTDGDGVPEILDPTPYGGAR